MSEREIFCPACGAAMERKLEDFTIGTDGGGGLFSSLLHDQYDVDLYACPQCGKVELYSSEFRGKEEAEAREKPEEVVCPVCGTKHSPLINCPTCVLRSVAGGRRPPAAPAEKERDRKPPWEK